MQQQQQQQHQLQQQQQQQLRRDEEMMMQQQQLMNEFPPAMNEDINFNRKNPQDDYQNMYNPEEAAVVCIFLFKDEFYYNQKC